MGARAAKLSWHRRSIESGGVSASARSRSGEAARPRTAGRRRGKVMPPDYVPLAWHSWYSLLRGVDSIESLCEGALRIGARALALTVVTAVDGAVPVWVAA